MADVEQGTNRSKKNIVVAAGAAAKVDACKIAVDDVEIVAVAGGTS